jgi:hypothetical protein
MDEQPPEPKPKKATSAVIAARVEAILRLRIDGAQFHDIRDYANQPPKPEEPWQVSDSQLKRYIQKSDELLRQRTEKSKSREIRLHLARREGLYARALKWADFKTALAVLDSLAKLRGLFPDPRVAEVKTAEIPLVEVITDGPTDGPTEQP